MEVLKENSIIKYHPDTLHFIRNLYDLDKPGKMAEAINIIEEWCKKQEHFNVKTLPKHYLERIIINNKGSLEASKRKLDKACTFKTLLPDFFGNINLNNYTGYKMFTNALLPKMTSDYGRVYLVICYGDDFKPNNVLEYYKYFLLTCEYIQAYDYTTGIIYLIDARDMNLLEFVKCMNFVDFKKVMDISMEGYCLRIKGVHILTNSKAVDIFAMFLRQAFGKKIGERVQCHRTIESLYDVVPRDMLPKDFGGEEKYIAELRDDLLNEIRSDDFMNYCTEIRKASTDEKSRNIAKFNEEYMGMPGTFRKLNVD